MKINNYNFNKKNLIRNVLLLIFIVSIGYLFQDFNGPKEIKLKEDIAFGIQCLRASDLLVQGYDEKGNLWATRGMIVYQLKKGQRIFTKIAHIPTGFSLFWLRNFSIVRKLTKRPECVEMVATDKGEICALSAGYLWYCPPNKKTFTRTIQLKHYGFGDQGIFPTGIIRSNDTTIFYGEYFQNPDRISVRLFRSGDNGLTWNVRKTFDPGEIRHIHAIHKDPFSKKLWICVGDDKHEPMLAWSEDEFKSIIPIGKGSQTWRITQLAFTEKSVYWGADTNSDEAGIYRWDRNNNQVTKLLHVDGAIFHATQLAKGTIVMSTDREGFNNEKDEKTRLYIITKDEKIKIIECGTWKRNKKGFFFKFAKLRFPHNQGSSALCFTVLNQKEFPDGDFIMIEENNLLQEVK